MAKKKTIAASRAKAKVEGLTLPLNTPAVAPTPAREAAVEAKRPTASAAKPAVVQSQAQAQAQAQPVSTPSKSPSKTADKKDPIAEGQEMIATLETCGAIAAKGAESLGKEVVSVARGSVQAQFALTEALMNAKSFQDALTAQGNFARESLDNMTEGFAKLTGMSMELTQTFMAPIQARVSNTARSIWRPAA